MTQVKLFGTALNFGVVDYIHEGQRTNKKLPVMIFKSGDVEIRIPFLPDLQHAQQLALVFQQGLLQAANEAVKHNGDIIVPPAGLDLNIFRANGNNPNG